MADLIEEIQAQPPVAPVVAPVAPVVADTGKSGPAKPWMAQLKKELQDNTVLSQYEDFSSVAQRVVEFEAKKDRLLEIPAADAPEEVKAQFRAKLGVPAKVDDYKIEAPKLPDGMKWNKAAEAEFLSEAHKLGLNNAQAQALLQFDTNRTLTSVAARQQAVKAQQEAQAKQDKEYLSKLQSTWGSKFDENKAKATDAMSKTTSEGLRAFLSEKGVMDHPLVAEFFHDLAGHIGEGEFIKGGIARVPPAPSLISAEQRAKIKAEFGR